jgi:hypothetical protein
MRTAAALLLLPLLAAKSDPLADRTPGRPAQCLSLPTTQGPEILDERTILYRTGRDRIWRTTPIGTCPGLRPNTRLIIDIYGGQICRNDRFRTLDVNDTIPGPYCRFGPFVPYDKPKTSS